jgi:sarcosine oxidase subunit alpha
MTDYDVAIVGAGPAGRLAAMTLFEAGANAVIVDENAIDPSLLPTSSRLRILEKSTVWAIYPGFRIGVSAAGSEKMISAKRVILATGSTEKVLSFPGSDLPGVMTGRGLTRLLNHYRVWPGGRRVAILGHTLEADYLAKAITWAGGDLVYWADDLGLVLEAVARDGVVAELRVDGESYPVDVIAISIGEQPDISLAAMIECEVGYSDELGGFTPQRSDRLETSIPGLYVCGMAAGTGFSDGAVYDALIAALAAAQSLDMVSEQTLKHQLAEYQKALPDRVRAMRDMTMSWMQHDVSRSLATPVGEF